MAIVYKVNDLNGKIHYLIGYSDSLVAAEGNKKVIDTIVLNKTETKIVHVNRFGITEVK